MTLITTCPNCHTSFNVEPEQLAKARGKVRCGQCTTVFNALKFLDVPVQGKNNENEPEVLTHSTQPIQKAAPSAPVQFSFTYPQLYHLSNAEPQYLAPKRKIPKVEPQPVQTTSPKPEKPAETLPPNARRRLIIEEEQEEDIDEDGEDYSDFDEDDEHYDHDEDGYNDDAEKIEDFEIDDYYRPEPIVVKTDKSYIRLYGVLGLLGLLLLITQLIVINRINLNANFPEFGPAIKTISSWFNAKVYLPRHKQLLRTEWSETSRVPEYPQLIKVDAVLKNHAHYAQEYPQMILSLFNSKGQTIMKRNLSPTEYLSLTDLKLGQFNADSQVKISMNLNTSGLDVSGANIEWFYPPYPKR